MRHTASKEDPLLSLVQKLPHRGAEIVGVHAVDNCVFLGVELRVQEVECKVKINQHRPEVTLHAVRF